MMLYLVTILLVAGVNGEPAPSVQLLADGTWPDTVVVLRSPNKAFIQGILWTGVPIALGVALEQATDASGMLVLGGMVGGPSAGHFYTANDRQAWTGLAIRGGGLVVAFVGAAIAISNWNLFNPESNDDEGEAVGFTMTLVGVSVIMADGVYDLLTAPRSARRYNEQHQAISLQMTPTYFTAARAPGLSVRVRF